MGKMWYPPETYLDKWAAENELSAARFVARLDEVARNDLQITPAKLARIDKYCVVQNGDPVISEASFESLLTSFYPAPSGPPILKKAAPVLFRMLVYLSRYPFMPEQATEQKGENAHLSRNGLVRAVLIAHKDRARRTVGGYGGGHTRTRTAGDHRRLLFQGLAVQLKSDPQWYDEKLWQADAALRARRFYSGISEEVSCPDNALTNRDEMGDELFHDVVDFMCQLLPDWEENTVRRENLLGLAKGIVQEEGLCRVPLQRYELRRADFEALVEMLLLVYESGEETLPTDFAKRRDQVVEQFFGQREGIDFKVFDEVSGSGRTDFDTGSAGGNFAGGDDYKPSLLEMLYWMLDELFKETAT
ncbi:hypothetical protein JX265_002631 [Neoarthrinium moseri]|uniref:Uncharacterized protein n=1 Tax=Neoarthrinium moseri TaxID=1658444 RepID=A0A9P9WV78_9PEZI|nr:hypothetical protein JX265_002631 [Neoarthrinium moseri]